MTLGARLARSAAALAAALTLSTPPAVAEIPAEATLDASSRRAAVEQAAARMRDRYVFPEVGARAAETIERALASGAYDGLTEPQAFADKLTADLYAVTRDKHLRIQPSARRPPRPGAARPARSESGVAKAERLAGGVGYLEIDGFPAPEVFKPALDRAMAQLADAPALIIDVRNNGGGWPSSVAYLVSHFLDGDAPVLINAFYGRTPGTGQFTREDSFSVPTPVSLRGKPLYVLTSSRTFSGGEEFAYDVQAFKLGILVGETTGGGANPGGVGPITPQFSMFVPDGRPVTPVTNTNWEGVGVKPDIATPAADALGAALDHLGRSAGAGGRTR